MDLQPPPHLLYQTPQGTWRVTGTRVSLDSVIHDFWNGATPETTCQDFPTLSLTQVRDVLAYYQRHKDQIDTYLHEQQQGADQIRQELQARHGDFLANLRQRLASR